MRARVGRPKEVPEAPAVVGAVKTAGSKAFIRLDAASAVRLAEAKAAQGRLCRRCTPTPGLRHSLIVYGLLASPIRGDCASSLPTRRVDIRQARSRTARADLVRRGRSLSGPRLVSYRLSCSRKASALVRARIREAPAIEDPLVITVSMTRPPRLTALKPLGSTPKAATRSRRAIPDSSPFTQVRPTAGHSPTEAAQGGTSTMPASHGIPPGLGFIADANCTHDLEIYLCTVLRTAQRCNTPCVLGLNGVDSI